MPSPFPGMDPYLEHPVLWPDVHNSLLAALRDSLSPQVAPRYYIALERRTYLLTADDLVFVGRPDVAVVRHAGTGPTGHPPAVTTTAVLEVEVPMAEEVEEIFLEVRDVATGQCITIMELLSPVNKLLGSGRRSYLEKRTEILRTRTSLVEIDLLRAGEPMPVVGPSVLSDYRILVSRGTRRPRAQLLAWSLREPIPSFGVPLLEGDREPIADVGAVLHALYDRARFDLRLDYGQPPVPPLADDHAAWARSLALPRS